MGANWAYMGPKWVQKQQKARKRAQCVQWMFLSSARYEVLQEHVFEFTGRQQTSELNLEICSCCWQHV